VDDLTGPSRRRCVPDGEGGPGYAHRQRDFASRRFRYLPLDVRGLDRSQPPEDIFSPANIGTRFELREETRATDFYDAEQTTTSFYGMLDLPLAARWQLIAGARVERFDQRVTTFDLFDTDAATIDARIKATDLFPSVNLVFAPRADQNVRFGFSQTGWSSTANRLTTGGSACTAGPVCSSGTPPGRTASGGCLARFSNGTGATSFSGTSPIDRAHLTRM